MSFRPISTGLLTAVCVLSLALPAPASAMKDPHPAWQNPRNVIAAAIDQCRYQFSYTFYSPFIHWPRTHQGVFRQSDGSTQTRTLAPQPGNTLAYAENHIAAYHVDAYWTMLPFQFNLCSATRPGEQFLGFRLSLPDVPYQSPVIEPLPASAHAVPTAPRVTTVTNTETRAAATWEPSQGGKGLRYRLMATYPYHSVEPNRWEWHLSVKDGTGLHGDVYLGDPRDLPEEPRRLIVVAMTSDGLASDTAAAVEHTIKP